MPPHHVLINLEDPRFRYLLGSTLCVWCGGRRQPGHNFLYSTIVLAFINHFLWSGSWFAGPFKLVGYSAVRSTVIRVQTIQTNGQASSSSLPTQVCLTVVCLPDGLSHVLLSGLPLTTVAKSFMSRFRTAVGILFPFFLARPQILNLSCTTFYHVDMLLTWMGHTGHPSPAVHLLH